MLRRAAYALAIVLLVAAAALFTTLNQQRFVVDFGFATSVVSSGLALVIAFAAGLFAGALVRAAWIARLLFERGRLRNALRTAEARRAASDGAPADAG
jgi:uncharacterized membrane protein YciS (DUF1049 family)